jgi:hypothetical protein
MITYDVYEDPGYVDLAIENNNDNKNLEQEKQNKSWWGKIVGFKLNLQTTG